MTGRLSHPLNRMSVEHPNHDITALVTSSFSLLSLMPERFSYSRSLVSLEHPNHDITCVINFLIDQFDAWRVESFPRSGVLGASQSRRRRRRREEIPHPIGCLKIQARRN